MALLMVLTSASSSLAATAKLKPKLSLAPVASPTPAYTLLEQKALKMEKESDVNGWGYIISGAAVMVISVPGYYLTQDLFAQVVYSVGETLGVGAITYGYSLVLIDNEYVSFYKILKDSPGLSTANKEELSSAFFRESAIKAKRVRRVRLIFHSLTASLNFLNAATTSNSDLRAALYFLGGINSLAVLHYLFSVSDEEKTEELLRSEKSHVSIEPMIGPVVGLQLHW